MWLCVGGFGAKEEEEEEEGCYLHGWTRTRWTERETTFTPPPSKKREGRKTAPARTRRDKKTLYWPAIVDVEIAAETSQKTQYQPPKFTFPGWGIVGNHLLADGVATAMGAIASPVFPALERACCTSPERWFLQPTFSLWSRHHSTSKSRGTKGWANKDKHFKSPVWPRADGLHSFFMLVQPSRWHLNALWLNAFIG